MLDYQYTYLIMGLVFFLIWGGLYLWRKDTRHQMMVFSAMFAFAGPAADLLYLKDWWSPQFIFSSYFSIESILTGFMIGGISTVLYEDVFRRRVVQPKSKKFTNKSNRRFIQVIGLAAFLFFGSFYLFQLNSLWSTIIALVAPLCIVLYHRRDLIPNSLSTGMLMVLVAIIVYTIIELVTPGWIKAFWYFKNTLRITILNVPIDDIVWYFIAGMFIGPLYEFWEGARFRRLPQNT